MNSYIKKFLAGLLLMLSVIGSVHAVYVGGNPLSYTDPEGLTPKGLPKRAIELLPLEAGGGASPFGAGRASPSTRYSATQPSATQPPCPPEVYSTLERVRAGQSFPHRNDGSTFQNREGLLPIKPDGYYREWVHPTPGIAGPGQQRVVTGQGGEVYYTPDHYRTFIPLP